MRTVPEVWIIGRTRPPSGRPALSRQRTGVQSPCPADCRQRRSTGAGAQGLHTVTGRTPRASCGSVSRTGSTGFAGRAAGSPG